MLRDIFTSEKGSEGSSSSNAGASRSGNPLSGFINPTLQNIQKQEDFYSHIQQGSSSLQQNHHHEAFSPFQYSSTTNGRVSSGDSATLSPMSRMKMKERSERITRHLYPDMNEQTNQLNQRFGAMNIGGSSSSNNYSGSSSMFSSSNMGDMGEENAGMFLQNHSLDSYLNMLQQQVQSIGEHINQEQGVATQLHEPYIFLTSQTTNPYLQHQDHQYQNLYELAKRLLSQENQQNATTTNTEQAILALEAQVILEPHHADAWYALGQCHAECDDDARAIACYAEAFKQDNNHLDALVDLGVSNANELQKHVSLMYLKRWITSHPIYASVIGDLLKEIEMDDHVSATMVDFYQVHSKVRKLFEKAVAESPTKDAKLYTALGVLYHLVNDYENAIQQFKMACQTDPTNHSLWNKLGATHANAKKPELAIECYRRALNLKPDYVRAWVNLGISHSNRAEYETAAKFYLRSLKLCPRNNHVWYYLSYDFSCLQRKDLVEKCKRRNVDLFKSDFQF
ncbi:hypothetical protein C9374_011247 [Naegleria lovaniensis]|uniref:Peroxin-5 n=1 Tax=Naegleria lovaniensis TaxID=51637 RepID=A0AA88H3R0_NAELO|nr:Peroxin 5 (Pex5), putative [Naegleria lovaniensis]KAG2392522.1 hypothetical protein C9374_011247 [Naegleria lovaniensis]